MTQQDLGVPTITVHQVPETVADDVAEIRDLLRQAGDHTSPEEISEEMARQAQAMSEGVPPEKMITFEGRQFRPADKIGFIPLMKFAALAKQGMSTDDASAEELMDMMATMYQLLKEAVHPDNWEAFEKHATAVHADPEQLLTVVQQAITVMTARPTSVPSGSLPSSSGTTQRSTGELSPTASQRARDMGMRPVQELLDSA
jgi:hypothetical protein